VLLNSLKKLTDNGITFSLLRKGKEAITLGERARPSLSSIVTKSDDIEVNGIKEPAKLKNDSDDASLTPSLLGSQ